MPRVTFGEVGGYINLINFFPLLLFAGCICDNPTIESTLIIPSTEQANNTDQNSTKPNDHIVTTPVVATDPTCQDSKPLMQHRSHSPIIMKPVDNSRIILEGNSATLECQFKAPSGAKVFWKKSCSPNCSSNVDISSTSHHKISTDIIQGWSKLSFHSAQRNDTGMYYCSVIADNGYGQSCGTYLWVRSEYKPYTIKG